MKKKKLLAVVGGICLILVLATLPFMAACAKPAPAPGPIVWKAVTFLPETFSANIPFFMFTDKVNERAKGELVIEYLGGPEVIKSFDLAMATIEGAVDIGHVPASYHVGIVPGVQALMLSRIGIQGERDSGAHDFMVELHAKAGLFYLGRGNPKTDAYENFHFVLKDPIERPQDLAGKKLGLGVVAAHFLEQIGVANVVISMPDSYSALERGLVDGFLTTITPVVSSGWHEVSDYVVKPGMFMDNVVNFISLDRWNQLPPHLQDLVIEAKLEVEHEYPSIWKVEVDDAAWQKMIELGMQVIELSPADAEWMIETAYRAEWDAVIENLGDLGRQLEELYSP